MTAKEQVLAVYPDAYCRIDNYGSWHINSTLDEGIRTRYGFSTESAKAAWESALQNIKNETK